MYLNYSGTNIHAFGHIDPNTSKLIGGPQSIHWIRPGWSEIPSDIWKMYESHPEVLKMIKEKKLQLMDETIQVTHGKKKVTVKVGLDDTPLVLKDFPEAKAIAVIKETYHPDILQRWCDEETRPKVRKVLDEQIKPLQRTE